MTPQLSLYLDLTRFLAALAVFVAHFSLHRLSDGSLWRLNAYGAQAVTFFFVLSGFVIAHATKARETTVREYTLARAARIYSVALPAVVLTVLLDQVGQRINPASYFSGWGYESDVTAQRLFAALTFTNELWTREVRQGSNAAYWSLGYEVPFYVLFGLALFSPPRWRLPAIALGLLICGPAVALAWPIWLAGWAAYHYSMRNSLSQRQGLLLFMASIAAWLAYEALTLLLGRPFFTPGAYLKRHELLQDYILTPIFVANLIGFKAAAPLLGRALMPLARPIRALAACTFTMYLCHEPIAQFLAACSPWPVTDWRCQTLILLGTPTLVFMLAAVTEQRKQDWRRCLQSLWPARTAS